MVLVTPHCTLSCHQTSELPYEITGLLFTEKSRSEQERMEEKRRRSMIFLPRSGLQAGWSEGDRWIYQKVTRVWVSPRITSWYFSSTTRPPHHHLSPSSRTPRLAPSQFQTGQLDYWTIETLFLTLDHSPPTSLLPPHTLAQRWAILQYRTILLYLPTFLLHLSNTPTQPTTEHKSNICKYTWKNT